MTSQKHHLPDGNLFINNGYYTTLTAYAQPLNDIFLFNMTIFSHTFSFFLVILHQK